MTVSNSWNPLQQGTGWRADRENYAELRRTARDLAFAAPVELPEEVDPRGDDGGPFVEDQGPRNSCVGNSGSSVLEELNYLESGVRPQFSRWMAYLEAQRFSGLLGQDQGASIWGFVQAAKSGCACLETTFPYPRGTEGYNTRIPPSAQTEAARHPLRHHVELTSYDELLSALGSRVFKVIAGIPWYESSARSTGLLTSDAGRLLGYHAVALLGYSRRRDAQGRNYLLLFNSHSRQWGADGVAEVAPQLCASWLRARDSFYGLTLLDVFLPRLSRSRGV